MTQTAEELITPELAERAREITTRLIYRYRADGSLHDDLYSAANLSLVDSAARFDPDISDREHSSFYWYALSRIRWAVAEEYRTKIGREDGHTEGYRSFRRPIELQEYTASYSIEDELDQYADREYIYSLCKNQRTRKIVIQVLLGFTQEEIGAEFNVTSSRISQILHSMSSNDTKRNNVDSLTEREIEIVRLFASGLNAAAIADKLHLTQHTIRSHVKHVRHKLSAKTITQSVAIVALEAPELITEGRLGSDQVRRSDL